jgi:sulfur-oxidizing protein SoxY
MMTSRRQFMGRLVKSLGLFVAVINLPRVVWASWNSTAFSAEDIDSAISETYGGLSISDSDAITLKAPSIAENGAVVPISVKTELPATSISVFVEKNPSPLACKFNIQSRMSADVSVRIRMGQTSNLIVLVEANGQLYRTTQEVKVTIGGCGG